jgi:hypothetical protein
LAAFYVSARSISKLRLLMFGFGARKKSRPREGGVHAMHPKIHPTEACTKNEWVGSRIREIKISNGRNTGHYR